MNVTQHFTFDELTASGAAKEQGIRNTPHAQQVANIGRLAMRLERVRFSAGSKPILVTSGYRSPELNAAVGGSTTSAHMDGRAADIVCPGFDTQEELLGAIYEAGIEFDQIIQYPSYLHFAIERDGEHPRQQLLRAVRANGYTRFEILPNPTAQIAPRRPNDYALTHTLPGRTKAAPATILEALRAGTRISNPEAWKSGAVAADLAVLIGALAALAAGFGFVAPLEAEGIEQIAAAIVAVVAAGSALTHVITTRRIGLPTPPAEHAQPEDIDQ